MPRPLRVEFAGDLYPLMSRGERCEAIFFAHEEHQTLLRTLGEAGEKTACLCVPHADRAGRPAGRPAGPRLLPHGKPLSPGIQEDSAQGRLDFQGRMKQRRRKGESPEMLACLCRGWRLGGADFLRRLREKLRHRGQPHERARERREADTKRAGQIVRQGLHEVGWTEADLDRHPKGHPHKVALARQLRRETPMSRDGIAKGLCIGSARDVLPPLARP